jgi:hypothetical protein
LYILGDISANCRVIETILSGTEDHAARRLSHIDIGHLHPRHGAMHETGNEEPEN